MAAQEEDDKPLDPKVEAIRVKMVRLLMVSGGIMMVGLMTVLLAIVYKITQSGDQSAARLVTEAELTLPEGATISETSISDDKIALTLSLANGGREIRIFTKNGDLSGIYRIR